MKSQFLALATFLVAVATGSHAVPRFTLEALPQAPGPTLRVTDINDIGQVGGVWSTGELDDDLRGFVYTPGAGFRPTHPPGWNPHVAVPGDLNNRGEAAGAYLDMPYVYRPDGTGGFIPRIARPNRRFPPEYARAINEEGQIVGLMRAEMAFFYDPDTGSRRITASQPNHLIQAEDINNEGVVLITETEQRLLEPPRSQLHLLDTDTWTRSAFGSPLGVVGSAVLNDRGDVALTHWPSEGESEALLFTEGRQVLLAPLPGDSFNSVLQMNNAGHVLGSSFGDDPFNPNHRAWLYTPDDGVIDLLSHVDAATRTGWTNLRFSAMNDVGQLAGVGLFQGVSRGFVLNLAAPVPEPATALMLMAGMALVASRSARRR